MATMRSFRSTSRLDVAVAVAVNAHVNAHAHVNGFRL
jgi:hypothetical protein